MLRHIELTDPLSFPKLDAWGTLFQRIDNFVTAFPSRKQMTRYLAEIAWETDVWVSEAPDHLIHFNGERFLGPYE